LHGHLPEIPDADLLLIGGDLVPITHHDLPWSRDWLAASFRPWLGGVAARMPVVGVAGNHDFIFQDNPDQVPELPWTYLQDSETKFRGLRIWGSPWQPWFYDWAFNLREPELCEKWELIPGGTNILLLHGAPFGHGDLSFDGHHNLGSPSLARRIEVVWPQLVVFGHIHCGYGMTDEGGTVYVNASHMDERYKPVNPPIVVELPD
jgi:hypothetical protein